MYSKVKLIALLCFFSMLNMGAEFILRQLDTHRQAAVCIQKCVLMQTF